MRRVQISIYLWKGRSQTTHFTEYSCAKRWRNLRFREQEKKGITHFVFVRNLFFFSKLSALYLPNYGHILFQSYDLNQVHISVTVYVTRYFTEWWIRKPYEKKYSNVSFKRQKFKTYWLVLLTIMVLLCSVRDLVDVIFVVSLQVCDFKKKYMPRLADLVDG